MLARTMFASVPITALVVALAAVSDAGTPFLVLDETTDWEVVWLVYPLQARKECELVSCVNVWQAAVHTASVCA